jgi:hypothetical protein
MEDEVFKKEKMGDSCMTDIHIYLKESSFILKM